MDLVTLARLLEAEELDLRITGTQKNLFVIHMPAQVTVGVLLRELSPGATVDHEIPRFHRTTFQAIVRHDDFLKGRKLAEDVSRVLSMECVDLDGMHVHYIRPDNLPYVFPASQGDLLEFSVNFDACYVLAV